MSFHFSLASELFKQMIVLASQIPNQMIELASELRSHPMIRSASALAI